MCSFLSDSVRVDTASPKVVCSLFAAIVAAAAARGGPARTPRRTWKIPRRLSGFSTSRSVGGTNVEDPGRPRSFSTNRHAVRTRPHSGCGRMAATALIDRLTHRDDRPPHPPRRDPLAQGRLLPAGRLDARLARPNPYRITTPTPGVLGPFGPATTRLRRRRTGSRATATPTLRWSSFEPTRVTTFRPALTAGTDPDRVMQSVTIRTRPAGSVAESRLSLHLATNPSHRKWIVAFSRLAPARLLRRRPAPPARPAPPRAPPRYPSHAACAATSCPPRQPAASVNATDRPPPLVRAHRHDWHTFGTAASCSVAARGRSLSFRPPPALP